jgi:hypothetical protein
MRLKQIIARYKLFSAEERLNSTKDKLLKTNDLLRLDILRVKKAQENYDKAFKIWWGIGTHTKKG